MSKREKARVQVSSMLDPDETISAFAHAQLSTVRTTAPPPAWVVVTGTRLLLYHDVRTRRAPVGRLLFGGPRTGVALSLESRVLHHVTIADGSTGRTIARLDFGWRRSDARAVAEAPAGDASAGTAGPGPEGDVVSLRPGELLPDGRVLSASEWLRALQESSGRYR